MENPKILQDLRARKLIAKKGWLQPGHREADSCPSNSLGCLLSVCDGPDRGRDREPDEEATVQKDLDAVNQYEQRFASAVSTIGQQRQEPVDRIREAVTAYEKDLNDLVKAARYERRAKLIQELHSQVGSFDTRI